jgi:galactokinase
VAGENRVAEATDEFRRLTGESAEGVWQAPGRVNLIGEHTDYNAGLALPFAIDRGTVVAARRRPDRLTRVWSVNLGQNVTADLADLRPSTALSLPSWARYPLGVAWGMGRRGADVPGFDISVSSTVPLGSGLSSSAALTVSVAVTLNDLTQAGLDHLELAKTAQEAETSFAGVPCGLLDQLAALDASAGFGVLIDFESLKRELVPLDIGPMVVISTGVERANAAGAYANRRAACEEATRQLGLTSLRDATLEMVEARLTGEVRRRARHIVTENGRVAEAVTRLLAGQPLGDLLTASHLSLRDDYEVSCPELDLAVETAEREGAAGARLTGAGFGGCAISIGVGASALTEPVSAAFAEAGFGPPTIFAVAPSQGAGRLA